MGKTLVIGLGYRKDYASFGQDSITDRAATFRSETYRNAAWRATNRAEKLWSKIRNWYHGHNLFTNTPFLISLAEYDYILYRELLMTKRTSKSADLAKPEWKGFLELRLSEQQLLDADAWKLSANAAMESVSSLILEGYKLNLSYSTKIDMATAMLTASGDMKELAGWALSAQGENGADALKLLLYKHYEVLQRDWTPLISAPPRVRRG